MKRMFLHFMAVLLMLSAVFSEAHGQWAQGNGIYGGTVTALASSGNTVFAGTYKNGIYSSADNGGTWIQSSLNNLDVQAIAISGNTIYAGIYDDGTGSMTSGVYRSSDFGVTWTQTALNNTTVSDLAVNGNYVFAATDIGVFISDNNGTTWTLTSLPEEDFLSIEISGSSVFAGSGSSGVWVSSNNGNTWSQTSLVGETVYSIAISGLNVFVGTYWSGVYRSTDFGVTWTQTAMNYQEVHALHIIGGNIFAGTIYEGVYLSSDNGVTWEQTSMWDKNVDALTSINNTLFAGLWGGGVYLTNDNGVSWSQTTLNNDDVRAFVSSGNNLFAGSASNGIYKSPDNGLNWSHQAMENIPVLALGTHGNYLLAGGDYSGVYRSADNGETWTNSGLGFESVYSFASLNNTVFAGTLNFFGAGKVYKSTNNGGTWVQSTPTLTNRNFVSLAVSGTRLFAGTFFFNMNNMFDPTRYGIYKSDDNGATWTQTTLNDKNVWSLAVNGSTIFAGTFELYTQGSGVYRSLDNGQTWEQTSLNDRNVLSIAVAGENVFAGTDNGIYLSMDNGVTWTPFNEGFGSIPEVYGLFATNDYLFAGTSTNSAWRRSLLPQSSDAEILSFAFNAAENPSLPADIVGTINPATFSITLDVLENIDVSSLIATFTLSNLASASIGGVIQESGVTANNFTNPVVYTVTAEAGNTQDWTVTVTTLPCLSPWSYVVTGSIHTINIPLAAAPEIFGVPLAPYDWIGVFYLNDDGEETCGGAVQWLGTENVAIIAYGDDPTTDEKDGFDAGEIFRWRLSQCGNPDDNTAVAAYDPNQPNLSSFSNFGLSVLTSLRAASIQYYMFNEGWNSISSYLNPIDPAAANMFSPIVNNLTILSNLTSVYWPSQGVNSIGNWNSNSGYVAKVTGDVEFMIGGADYVSGTMTIPAGWSYLPVLSQCAADVMDMFGEHLADVVIIQDLIGTGVFWPAYEINTIGDFQSGKAYAIKLLNPVAVSFPACDQKSTTMPSSGINKISSIWGDLNYSPEKQTTAILKSALTDLQAGDLLGAFNADGLLCGYLEVATVDHNLAITLFGNDQLSSNANGLTNGEPVFFKLYRSQSGERFDMEVVYDISLENSTGNYHTGTFAAITNLILKSTGIDDMNTTYFSLVPNPATDVVTITTANGISQNVEILIYDMHGKMLIEESFQQQTSLNIGHLKPGVYMVVLRTAYNYEVKKLLVK
jgi:hypothetical protein